MIVGCISRESRTSSGTQQKPPTPKRRGFFIWVRSAWAHPCRRKFRHELVTASEVKRNCTRVTECGKEAWSVNREPMDKKRIEGAAKQGEQAQACKALVTKAL